jgi:hypothetical protein
VLRIGTSNDSAGGLSDDQRSWWIAADTLTHATGQEVETILKRAWPTDALPEIVSSWMQELQPDIVHIHVSNFWYAHPSVPLWFERKFGRAGKKLTDAGLAVGKKKWMSDNRFAIAFTRALVNVLPSATHFSVQQVAEVLDASIQRALRHEGTVVLVRGNDHWEKIPMASARANAHNTARNAAMTAAMRAICERHRVPYVQLPTIRAADLATVLGPARWHNSPEGERQSGELDGAALVAAWRASEQ